MLSQFIYVSSLIFQVSWRWDSSSSSSILYLTKISSQLFHHQIYFTVHNRTTGKVQIVGTEWFEATDVERFTGTIDVLGCTELLDYSSKVELKVVMCNELKVVMCKFTQRMLKIPAEGSF
jgi:hypothetical protein